MEFEKNCMSSAPKFSENYCEDEDFGDDDFGMCYNKNMNCDMNYLGNNFKNEKKIIKNENKNQFNDLQRIIMSQDIIEGYWEENEDTKNIENKFEEIFNKISNFVDSNEKIKNKSKVKYTFIILYYLINDEKEKLNENKLIINKGKKYLISNNTSYDEIFSKI
jgi:hypothetical protein